MTDLSPSETLAHNIRLYRRLLDLTQEDLGDLMADFDWTRQTVTEIERLKRRVYVDELVGLTTAFDASINELLAPALALQVARTLNDESAESVNKRRGVG